MPKRYYIYTLILEDNRIYVGMTRNLERRFTEHMNGKGARYTIRHKPLYIQSYGIVKCESPQEAEKYEDARTLELIYKYGIEVVRGGRFFMRNVKRSTINRNYKNLEDKYKNIKQYNQAKTTLNNEFKRKKKAQKIKNKKLGAANWKKQELKAIYELRQSYKRFEAY